MLLFKRNISSKNSLNILPEYSLELENIYSYEYYENTQNIDFQSKHVLNNISFAAKPGELWSIFGNSVFETKLLLEIMANATEYESGKMLIGGMDTIKQKRTVLPYVFYIGSTNMALGNMNVLEYLMFITSYSKKNVIVRQESLLNFLLDMDLGYICLTPISLLTPQEKSILLLLIAILSDSILIILNLPRLQYDQKQISSINNLAIKIRALNKTLIFNTQCYDLAQAISTHLCYLYKGSIIYKDNLKNFLNDYDRVIYVIGADNIDFMLKLLKYSLPQFDYTITNKTINVFNFNDGNLASERLFETFSKLNLKPTFVRRNVKNINNAIQGLIKLYDL